MLYFIICLYFFFTSFHGRLVFKGYSLSNIISLVTHPSLLPFRYKCSKMRFYLLQPHSPINSNEPPLVPLYRIISKSRNIQKMNKCIILYYLFYYLFSSNFLVIFIPLLNEVEYVLFFPLLFYFHFFIFYSKNMLDKCTCSRYF